MAASSPYPDVPQQPDFPELEREVIAFWRQDGTFEASVEQRPGGPDGDNEFVFYDGPPFANGLPHYGHLITGFVKDAVPRYQTMRGRRVERRFGWDCHGLPAEMAAERDLGLSGRQAILEYGVDNFNDYCRSLVENTSDAWNGYVSRSARWVDMENDYKTMDLPYMESVMWALKTLYDKGLLYESYRVLPYCWECETPLSNFETRQDDAYRDRQDPAVTVLFQLDSGEKVLVWTTTPWTLPSNLALAVGPDIDYDLYEEDGVRYVVGAATVGKYAKELAQAEKVGSLKGLELVGRRYTPLFSYFEDTPNAFVVLAGDFVSTEDGTGVVHLAPGFGEDDQRVCEANGIPVVCPVDSQARFTTEVPDFAGLQVFDANSAVVKALREKGAIVRVDSYNHSYPHCWRTDTPLIYKAVSSWFVRVTAIKDRMLALNQQINWVPEHVRDGSFGKWLESARDWSISRNRFWGSPIPVWKSDSAEYPRVDVYGSLDELKRDFGVRLDDLHRPAVDELVRTNPDDPTGASTMRRVEDVLDCWFESGSMPFAQVHYPFENKDWFEDHFPADFICEYIGQTRGWFYTLHVLATALFDRPAFSNCVVHGVLLGDDGRKLSKRLANYPDPVEVFDTLGSDAMRWALLSSAGLRGQDLTIDRRSMSEPVRQVLNPIWNAWYFFSLYANTEGYAARWRVDAAGVLDRYVLAKLRGLVEDVTARMDGYDLSGACSSVVAFLDALNNWYIRRSRDRFWDGDHDAFDTLYTVLEVLCRLTAPLLPLTVDAVYRGLVGDARSVHLTDWPLASDLLAPSARSGDDALVASMDLARDVCSAALSVRKEGGWRVRLPLSSLVVVSPRAGDLAAFAELVKDEVNVKEVRLTDDLGDAAHWELALNMAVLGPRLGPDTQKVLRAVKEGNWSQTGDGTVTVGDRTLAPDEYRLLLTPADPQSARALPGNEGLVVLDTAVTPELEAEGLARDVVRLVQVARRDAGLHVSDRIHLVLDPGDHADVRAAIETHAEWIKAETLAVDLVVAGPISDARRAELPDGRAFHLGLSKHP